MKLKTKFKRILSATVACAITASILSVMPASAEEAARYPYAVFAADETAGITINANDFTLNGSAYTNGIFKTSSQKPNINGTITDSDDNYRYGNINKKLQR